MTFRIPHVPKNQTPEEIAAGKKEQQRIKDQYKQWQINQKAAREAMLKSQAVEAEAERLAAIAAANQPTPATTEFDMSKGYIQNGNYVLKPAPQPSIAVSRVAILTERNLAALKK